MLLTESAQQQRARLRDDLAIWKRTLAHLQTTRTKLTGKTRWLIDENIAGLLERIDRHENAIRLIDSGDYDLETIEVQ